MDELFTPISQVYKSKSQVKPILEEVGKPQPKSAQGTGLSSFEDALEALKNEPDYDTLTSALRLLANGKSTSGKAENIHTPNPQNAQIIQALVTEIVPNYWRLLKDEAEAEASTTGESRSGKTPATFHLLLRCLRNLSGINAALTHLRGLMGELEASANDAQRSHAVLTLELLLDLLCSLLGEQDVVRQVWDNTTGNIESTSTMSRPLAQELVNVLGGGRVVSLAAEAERTVQKKTDTKTKYWVASSKDYSLWLARSLVEWTRCETSGPHLKLISDMLSKALRLGEYDGVVKMIGQTLLIQESTDGPQVLNSLLKNLPMHEQKRIIYSVLKYASKTFFGGLDAAPSESDAGLVSAVAGLLSSVVGETETRRSLLVAWLTDSVGAAPGESVSIRRAVMAVVAQRKDDATVVFEKSLAQFGEQLYIRHAPILQQEAHAQVLLLSAGYVHRINPIKLTLLARSSSYLNAVSNRLGASQTRARILGMIVGEALSGLSDKAGKSLNFDMAETNADEAVWFKTLVGISDSVGSVDLLRQRLDAHQPSISKPRTTIKSKQTHKVPSKTVRSATASQSSKRVIVEVVSSDEEEDDDLVPYAKPDSDPEDSEDDAELVRRDKPRAPVYIRDLIAYLRDSENYDRQRLALTTAPILIRRKANYGTEVKEHAEQLATLLVGLQDKYDMEDFADLRIQGMVAVFVAQPQNMGPWFSRTFFDGDYSLAQRASVLTVLGLGSRELGGYQRSDYAEDTAFPSKRLPENLERLYLEQQPTAPGGSRWPSPLKGLPPHAIDGIVRSITQSFLAPLAADAADKATGPDALKLSSFTSRLQPKQGAAGSSSSLGKKERIRAIPNTAAQLLATSVFFPLTARFQVALRAASSSGSSLTSRGGGVVTQPELLSHLLRTLGLLVHAAGPSTLSLPDMTAELWRLVLQARARCSGDLGATRAALFALLSLLDVNGAGGIGSGDARMRDICRDLGREVVETQEWVALVFEGTRGGDGAGGEEDEVKMLAAGVLIRLREAMDKFRAFMIGDMIG